MLIQGFRRSDQLFRGLHLALGMDDLGAALALCFSLARNRAHHSLIDIDMLDFHVRHLDTPGIRLLVEQGLDIGIQFFPLRQHIIQFVLPQHRAQRGLRQLAGCSQEVFHLDNRLLRINHTKVDHRIDLHRHIVTRYHVLARHIHHNRAQAHLDHLLYHGDHDDQPGTFYFPESSQRKDHPALVFPQDAERIQQQRYKNNKPDKHP